MEKRDKMLVEDHSKELNQPIKDGLGLKNNLSSAFNFNNTNETQTSLADGMKI